MQNLLGRFPVLHTSFHKDVIILSCNRDQLYLPPALILVWLCLSQHIWMPLVNPKWVLGERNWIPNKTRMCTDMNTEDKTNTWRPFASGNCLPFKSLHLTSRTNRVLSDAINSLFYSCKEAKIVFFKVLISILKNAFYLKT